MRKSNCILLVLLTFASCVKDKPKSPVQPQVQLSGSEKVYVINEGPFPSGSGSVSLYDPVTQDVIEDFYKTQNNSETGNIAQSMNSIRGKYYVVVNNAGNILVCDKQLKKEAQISGLRSPRYILAVTNQKAYVSDLYANAMSIVDLNSNMKTGSIPCPGKTERMVLLYNKVFITNTDKEYLYVVNTLSDKIVDSISVGKGAAGIVIDKHDGVWVLGSGDTKSEPGRLTKINPLNNQVELSKIFDVKDRPGNLCLSAFKDTLYFLNGSIYRMSISETMLPGAPFIERKNKNFYGLGVNPNDYTIYAADALDFLQRSQIYIYSADNSLKHSFKAGINSNGFYFE